MLPSKFKLFCDSSDDESRILASGGRNEGDESDRIFLELLAESAGEHFGIEMSGGAPVRVRTSIADRDFVVDLFLGLFEVAGIEADVRRALADTGVGSRRCRSGRPRLSRRRGSVARSRHDQRSPVIRLSRTHRQ